MEVYCRFQLPDDEDPDGVVCSSLDVHPLNCAVVVRYDGLRRDQQVMTSLALLLTHSPL